MDASAEREISQLQQTVENQTALIESLRGENEVLRRKIDAILKRFGLEKKSEAIDPAQLQMLMAGLMPPPPIAGSLPAQTQRVTAAPRRQPVRQPLPKHLPTEEILLVPEEVKQAPEQYKEIGREVTEELDFTPSRFIRRLYIRPKYVAVETKAAPAPKSPSDVVSAVLAELGNKEPKGLLMARLPGRLIEKGFPGAGLMAHVVISKYEDHLPLFRQEKIFRERHGVKIARQTLAEWVAQAAFWLKPIYELIKKQLLARGYLQVDETPIRYLDPDQPGKAQQGYLWVYGAPGGDVVFDWQTSRGKEAPAQFLKEFKGTLQADGYGVYPSLVKDRPEELKLAGCLAHVRRDFFEVVKEDRRAAWFVRQIAHLYGIEKRLRQKRAGPALRAAVRAAESRLILNRIAKVMELWVPQVLPQSGLGKAMAYAQGQWPSLLRYLNDGRLEIDNNLIENAIRPTALGKKNFLFIGHPGAGWYSAVIYSILGSCRRQGIDPHAYLRDVLQRLPNIQTTELSQLTPAAWAKANKANRHPVSR